MEHLRPMGIGIILGFLMMACTAWNYHEYTISAESYEGKLLGPKPENDIPFSDCKPTAADLAPCIAIKTAEFLRLKQDYIDTQNALKACQHGQAR